MRQDYLLYASGLIYCDSNALRTLWDMYRRQQEQDQDQKKGEEAVT